jgi:hypothetical protein
MEVHQGVAGAMGAHIACRPHPASPGRFCSSTKHGGAVCLQTCAAASGGHTAVLVKQGSELLLSLVHEMGSRELSQSGGLTGRSCCRQLGPHC